MPSEEDGHREWRQALLWFLATFTCVYWVYATVWDDGQGTGLDPLWFALSFLGILAVHEAGHYIVARLHGFELSPPIFIPFPAGFGTLGAVIRLRSLPRSRQALLEMGAAGPIAGALLAFAIVAVSIPWMRPGVPPPPSDVLPFWFALSRALDLGPPAWFHAIHEPRTILVFNDPPALKILGLLITGHIPGRYDSYHPATLGAWMGCLLTATNLVPVGQLDGGHVLNAVHPGSARPRTFVVLGAMVVGGWWWQGWWVFAAVAVLGGAWRPLPVPDQPAMGMRAWIVAIVTAMVFGLTFMPVPIEMEVLTALPNAGEHRGADPPGSPHPPPSTAAPSP